MNAVLLMLSAYLAVMSSKFGSDIQVTNEVWSSYKLKYDKQYSNVAEDTLRRQVLAYNIQKIQKFNEENSQAGFQLGVNQFADFTEEELRSRGEKQVALDSSIEPMDLIELGDLIDLNEPVPDHVDWRDVEGVVSSAKNMGYHCNAGWAFATVGLLEGQQRKLLNSSRMDVNRNLVELSAQQIIDCEPLGDGCYGGSVYNAVNLIKNNKGVMSERDYPYKGQDGICKQQRSKNLMKVKSFMKLTPGDEEILKRTVASYGPVAGGINASAYFWLYLVGVFNGPVCEDNGPPNHGVLIVGYGTDDQTGLDYWIVKSSSGTDWGEDGYIRMIRNHNGHCGIARDGIVAIV